MSNCFNFIDFIRYTNEYNRSLLTLFDKYSENSFKSKKEAKTKIKTKAETEADTEKTYDNIIQILDNSFKKDKEHKKNKENKNYEDDDEIVLKKIL